MSSINIVIDQRYYSKDPESTDLGRRIIHQGLSLMNELGFEQFTFKKLAERIGSTEASVYRYFENKQKLLIYLNAWYWSWVDYRIDFDTHNLADPLTRMTRAWEILCHVNVQDDEVAMDVAALRRAVISESDKTYLTKEVDQINKEGLFVDYKSLCHRLALMIKELRDDYAYSHAMVSTLLEASHQQYFFANHLPALTEISKGEEQEVNKQVHGFIMDTMNKILATNTVTV